MPKKKKNTSAAAAARWVNAACVPVKTSGSQATPMEVGVSPASAFPSATRRVTELASSLFLVSDPSVIVCRRCMELTVDPISHLENNHKADKVVIDIVKRSLEGVELDNSWLSSRSVSLIEALPFFEVVDGCKCTSGGKTMEHAKNLDCCDVRRNGGDVEKVRIQRCIRSGACKKAVEVKEVKYNIQSSLAQSVQDAARSSGRSIGGMGEEVAAAFLRGAEMG